MTALHTGMRLREILDLEWGQIDLEFGIISVTRTKTNENSFIPIDDYLSAMLTKLPRKCKYVFSNRDGKPFITIRKGFYAAVRRAGLGHFRFHDLRHNFASHLVMKGVDLITVKELLGHKQISTTMRYSHLSNEHNKDGFRAFIGQLWTPNGHQDGCGQKEGGLSSYETGAYQGSS